MEETRAILVTLVIYKIILVVVGVLANRRTKDTKDFFLGGRRMGPWVAALSASASSSSAWSLLGVSGAAYSWGLGAAWLIPSCIGGFLINWYLIAPRLRRYSAAHGALTVTDVLSGPRGPDAPGAMAVARVASAIVLVSLLVYVASQFHGAGKTFAETFDMELRSAVLLGAAIVSFYTLLGGFWAVSLTDTIQGFVMAGAAVVVPIAALIAVGGLDALWAGMQASTVTGYASLTRDMTPVVALGFVVGLLGIGIGYPGQPHVVNRFMALRDDRGVAVGRRVALVWATIIYVGMLLAGWCARISFPGLEDPEVALLSLTTELFSPVAAGVMVAAVLSAIMSTADSQLLVVASSASHDLRRSEEAESSLARSRVVVLGACGIAALMAVVADDSIFDRVLFAFSAMGAAFGPLLLVTLFRGRRKAAGSVASMLVGFASSVLAFYVAPAEAKGVLSRVLPFALALAVAWFAAPADVDSAPAEAKP